MTGKKPGECFERMRARTSRPVDVRHHHVEEDEIESLSLNQNECFNPTDGLGRTETVTLEAAPQNLAIFTDIVNNEKPRLGRVRCALLFSEQKFGRCVLAASTRDSVVGVHR